LRDYTPFDHMGGVHGVFCDGTDVNEWRWRWWSFAAMRWKNFTTS